MPNIQSVDSSSFATEVLASDTPVLVDFWAEWCALCRQVAPILEEIASEYAGKLRIVKLDIDANPDIAAQWSVTSVPTLHVYRAGEIVQTIIGAKPKPSLVKDLQGIL